MTGQHGRKQAQAVRELQPAERTRGRQQSAELREHPLGSGPRNPRRGLAREQLGFAVGADPELGDQPGEAQRAQRVGLIGRAPDDAQQPRVEVCAAAAGVDQLTAPQGSAPWR